MKKMLAFSLVTLLFLSGCGNQHTEPADPLPALSQDVKPTTAPSDTPPYIPKETIVETTPDVPSKEPLYDPESVPTETKAVSVQQAETCATTPKEPQHKAETLPPATVTEKSPDPSISEETPSQALPVPPNTQPETEPTTPQPAPPEVPSEPEIQNSIESVDDCVAYGKDYAISIGLTLDNTAIDCWDTPITSSDPYYIKRDITSRLNRYKDHEDVTDIWIWKESVGDGMYVMYIGYA